MAHSLKRIRTLALVGQAGSGKTSLAEALLARAGAVPAAGSVERGTTVCDYTAQEKQLQHSLKLAVASFDYRETKIHLLDTPGYPDFLGHSLPALAAVETAGIVVNAQNGLEMMSGRFMQWAAQRGLDRLVIVNKIDADNVDLEGLLRMMQSVGMYWMILDRRPANKMLLDDPIQHPVANIVGLVSQFHHGGFIHQIVPD